MTVTFDVGSGPTDTNTFSVDLNFFDTQNDTDNTPDHLVTLTNLRPIGADQ